MQYTRHNIIITIEGGRLNIVITILLLCRAALSREGVGGGGEIARRSTRARNATAAQNTTAIRWSWPWRTRRRRRRPRRRCCRSRPAPV